MKKYTIILFIALLGFSFAAHSQTKSFKRGLCFNALMVEDIEVLAPGVSWVYNWGHSTPGNADTFTEYGMEFIPMAWKSINKDVARAYLSAHPEVKYILGFNEPNFHEQANLTPRQAAERWPDIEEIADEFGLIIVGPALNYSPNAPYQDPIKWYDEFFEACPDCRVDHIAVHLYMPGANIIKSSIESYKKYGKPIWLTEFCAEGKTQTVKSQTKFLIETLDYLETDPDIFRYAWFKERGNFTDLPNMQVLHARNEGVLTDLGEILVNMSSYDDNFYFTTEKQIPCAHYIRMNKINMEKTNDTSGRINLYELSRNSWMDYNVDVAEAGEYNVFFRVASEFPDESVIYVSVDGQEQTSMSLDNKVVGEWNTQKCKITLNKGKQKIRLGFKKGGLKLNWWGISKEEQAPSGIGSAQQASLNIYPNPVEDILYIQSEVPVDVALSNLQGQTIHTAENVQFVDMSDYASGIYLLTVQFANGEKIVKKVIKK